SRYDAGAAALVAKPVDVGAIVTGVIDTVSMVAEQMSTGIVVHAPSSPVMAVVDRVRITRIVRNLVVNAIEHGEGNPIDIYVSSNAEAVAVSVRDHGVGMNEEQVEHVFDRFWRADPARKRTLGGSGLGLAISLEDAHLHDGWLQVWGKPGEGSCFRLTIPRRPDQEITSSPLPLPPRDAQIKGAALVAGPLSSDGSVRIQTGSIPIVVETDQQEPARTGSADEPGVNTPDGAEPSAGAGSSAAGQRVEGTSGEADSPPGQGGDDATGRETVLGELVGSESSNVSTDERLADDPGVVGEGTHGPDAGEDAPGDEPDATEVDDDTGTTGEDDDPEAPGEDDTGATDEGDREGGR